MTVAFERGNWLIGSRRSACLRRRRGTAAALAETMTGAVTTAANVAAVRGDVRESEARLRGEIRESESRLCIEIANLRSKILKRVIGAIDFQTIIVIGAVSGLFRLLH